MSSEKQTGEPIDMLRERIKDIRMAMLSTISDGKIVTRPMSAQDMAADGTIFFLTNVESHKVDEIAHYPSVNVSFCDSGSETYVSVAGSAKVTNDRALIRKFWNPFYKAWFEGPDDPTIRALAVTPVSAEYWITKGGKIVSLLSMLASAVTGKDMEAGENREITL
ncbi:MAG: pyridoxamine 5'-phosphate oxidase family protein [Gemmatimonadota bacterium]|nr:pyridoxamine 5'-phosphate oxidase family protein [Gemmatimonadota bacterium]